ncbi:putative membrane protein [Cricetibacter osteomyelitidis]|uniref:Putative membrane protein n=1 Tax=Cricetibacter osteomyelitidis TaxID=1521931 RepID=A0A4R2T2G2_9PAST|nr:Fe-S-containing protein [Cricetibacter osteomyelitidis]TCP95366.1 putative membrane protein [Cricetibacter osteomyelitidis]
MNYFFTHFLQSVLPFALLLGCIWANSPTVDLKKLKSTLFFSVIIAFSLTLIPLKSQLSLLIFNLIILVILLLLPVAYRLNSEKINRTFSGLLAVIALLQWYRDPNLAAITSTDVINTDFILNIAAIILGLLLCIFLAAWLYFMLRTEKISKLNVYLWGLLLILIAIPIFSDILLNLMKLQLIELTKVRLSFVAKATNLAEFNNYICAALLVMLMLIFTAKIYLPRYHIMATETDLIEKRKKTALFRSAKHLLLWGLCGILLIVTSQLYWDKVASQPPRLSEAKPVTLNAGNKIEIPIEQVKDGKLHRFVWISDEGKAVRFFIINKQPERLNLAVVFDACILCGDQGYVMQDNQVVCVGCGVYLFIPSIGKSGGCNPVPIEGWQQSESAVILSKDILEDGLNYFSTIVEIEVTDPVDGSKMKNTKTDHKYNYDGKTYFFATEQNLNLFRDNPEQYIK